MWLDCLKAFHMSIKTIVSHLMRIVGNILANIFQLTHSADMGQHQHQFGACVWVRLHIKGLWHVPKMFWSSKTNQQHCVENTGPCKGLEPPLISFYLATEMRGTYSIKNRVCDVWMSFTWPPLFFNTASTFLCSSVISSSGLVLQAS